MGVEWLPFELHPGIPPQGLALPSYIRDQSAQGANAHLLKMAQEAGMPMILADRLVNSRRALEASEFARQQGLHPAFHQVVFRKFYGEGQDMYDWAVLRAAAEEIGLDPDEMQVRTDRGDFSPQVDQSIQQAYRLGITGVPAYIFEDKYLIRGAQPYEVFQQAMQALGISPRKNGDKY